MNPVAATPGVVVATGYAAAVARRAGARWPAAGGWAGAAAVVSMLVVAVTWLVVFIVALEISCGDGGNCL